MPRTRLMTFLPGLVLLGSLASAEEGMYPINLPGGLDLRAKGSREVGGADHLLREMGVTMDKGL